MSLFFNSRPRRFSHQFIYHDEDRETKMLHKKGDEKPPIINEDGGYNEERLRGTIVGASKLTRKNKMKRIFSTRNTLVFLIFVLLLFVALWKFSFNY